MQFLPWQFTGTLIRMYVCNYFTVLVDLHAQNREGKLRFPVCLSHFQQNCDQEFARLKVQFTFLHCSGLRVIYIVTYVYTYLYCEWSYR